MWRRRIRTRGLSTIAMVLVIGTLVSSRAFSQANRSVASSIAAAKPPSRDAYAGDAACLACHQKESKAYETNAHHLTSQPADAHSIAGSFDAGANLFKTSNPSLYFKMTADEKGFHQAAVDEVSPGRNIELSEPFNIVVGAASKSQTYLYWKSDLLFELPVSWWTETHQWINSPGYQDGGMRFDRAIVPRCLECHASYFQSLAPPTNRYDRGSVTLGIECEKCHGPGREHVALYSSPTPPKPGARKAILNLASLPRNRQIDACALCHAGTGEPLAPALSFVPGADLERYLHIPAMDPDVPVDVHGNQVQLLKRSRCFQASAMTCNTCHQIHDEKTDAAAYSQYCLNCHKAKECGKFTSIGEQITRNCVDCHMPLNKSQALFFNTTDQTVQLPVRNHRIAVYPEAGDQNPHHGPLPGQLPLDTGPGKK